MKCNLFFIVLVAAEIGAMNNQKDIQKKSSKDFVVNFGGERITEDQINSLIIQNNNISLDNQLSEIEFSPSQDNNTLSFDSLLSKRLLSQGMEKEKAEQYILMLKNQNPQGYGQIVNLLVESKKKNNKSIDLDPKDLVTIDQKIQFELVRIGLDNQEIAGQNRKEDLAQAEKNRKCSLCMFVVSLVIGFPSLIMSIISVTKALH